MVKTISSAILEDTKHLMRAPLRRIVREEVGVDRASDNPAWTDAEVREWALKFKGLVLTSIDPNQGDTVVMCPMLYRHGFGKTFFWNANYERVGEVDAEGEIMKANKEDFLDKRLHTIGSWRPDGRFGTTYVIAKHKDLTRWRPITPAPVDPAALAQRRVARALHCLLVRLPMNCTFYLNSVSELAERLDATTVKLRTAGCGSAVGKCYDVKDMFSRIPHSAVLGEVNSLLQRYEIEGCRQEALIQVPAQNDEETNEMKEYFRKKIRKQKSEEERREKELEDRRKQEEEVRKEADRLREADEREARLEARLIRFLSQHNRTISSYPMPIKKKSPTTKARVLKEITSYLEESEDESEEVKQEAGRLIEAIEKRKGKKRKENNEMRVSRAPKIETRPAPILVEELAGELRTPPSNRGAREILDYALDLHRKFPAKKVPELRDLCNSEGIEWTKRETAIGKLVKCRMKLAYESEAARLSPLAER
ncbi:hypothetical protein CBR_g37804 [Chara braunii]|uniref:Uncharacterized protein n=1 Tax=Chara braunii TaxID=69332 RepID=A0A388LNZ0_CHABU|nr:hypothetical protein CBR_g37804 [Chara braunii]|eukprot:GBG83933.1 hypothetical protein CBR_g37804 [Chara braunii]